MHVVIGGGSGFIGTALAEVLKSKGHRVTVISRRKSSEDTITWDEIKNNGLPPTTEAVINFSGAKIMHPKERLNIDAYKEVVRDSRISTTHCLTEAIAAAPRKPKIWISSSAIGYYPGDTGEPFDEYSAGGTGAYPAPMIKEWEETAKLPGSCESVREIILRIGLVMGKDGGIAQNWCRVFRYGVGGPSGNGKQFFPWVHIDDVTGIILHAIENQNVSGIMNAVAPGIVSNEDFAKELCSTINRPCLFRVPEWILKLLLGSDWSILVLGNYNVIPRRVLDSGYNFIFPTLREALEDIFK